MSPANSTLRMDSLIPLIIGALWLLILTIIIVGIFLTLKRFSKGIGKGDIVKILDAVLSQEKKNTLDIEELKKRIGDLEDKNLSNISKVGLTKYNPYGELGGNHSFSLVLLNGNNSGLIITGLHARDKTRIYLKSVENGKTDLELSREESKTLSDTMKGRREN